jgi:hypothetical protein
MIAAAALGYAGRSTRQDHQRTTASDSLKLSDEVFYPSQHQYELSREDHEVQDCRKRRNRHYCLTHG